MCTHLCAFMPTVLSVTLSHSTTSLDMTSISVYTERLTIYRIAVIIRFSAVVYCDCYA